VKESKRSSVSQLRAPVPVAGRPQPALNIRPSSISRRQVLPGEALLSVEPVDEALKGDKPFKLKKKGVFVEGPSFRATCPLLN